MDSKDFEIKKYELEIKKVNLEKEYTIKKIGILEKEIEYYKRDNVVMLKEKPDFVYERDEDYLNLLKELFLVEKDKELKTQKLMLEVLDNNLQFYNDKIKELKESKSITN